MSLLALDRCGVSGPKSLVAGLKKGAHGVNQLTSSSLRQARDLGRASPRLFKTPQSLQPTLSKLSASYGETPFARRRRANRGDGGGGGGGEGGGEGGEGGESHATPPRPFLGAVNAGMASFSRTASMGSQKFAAALAAAGGGEGGGSAIFDLAGMLKKAKPKPQPPHVE